MFLVVQGSSSEEEDAIAVANKSAAPRRSHLPACVALLL